MKLWDAQPAQKMKVIGYDSSLEEQVLQRLKDLGFVEQALVECVRHTQFSGPRVFLINQTLFALEKSLAVMVNVEPLVEMP